MEHLSERDRELVEGLYADLERFLTQERLKYLGELENTAAQAQKPVCPDCGQVRFDDERVLAGMKCLRCASASGGGGKGEAKTCSYCDPRHTIPQIRR